MYTISKMPKNSKCKILFVEASANRYGSALSLKTLIESLDDARYIPEVALNVNSPLIEDLQKLGINVHILKKYESKITKLTKYKLDRNLRDSPKPLLGNLQRRIEGKLQYWHEVRSLKSIIKSSKPDIVHLNNQPTANRAAYFAIRGELPIIQHVRSNPDHTDNRLKKLVRTANAIICVSEFVKQQFLTKVIDHPKTHVIYNPVSHHFFDSANSKAPFSAKLNGKSRVIFGQVGRLIPLKGQLEVLKVFKRIVKKKYLAEDIEIRLLFIGDAVTEADQEYKTKLRSFIAENDLTDLVEFIPYQSNILKLLAELDCLVHFNSQGAAEGFGRVVAEAMACGKPTIVRKSGALPELVTPDDGYVVDSHEEFSKAIAELANHPGLRRALGYNARLRAAALFDAPEIASQVSIVYETIGL